MGRRTRGLTGMIAVIAAVSLLVAASASAGTYVVRGDCCADGFTMTGTLQGSWTWGDGGFEAFLSSMTYNQAAGLMTFRVPQVFVGTLHGRNGTLVASGFGVQRVKPGTPLYDFSQWPNDQPGTTGDPNQWLGGWGIAVITSGTGELTGASGIIHLRNLEFLGATAYWGVVRVPS